MNRIISLKKFDPLWKKRARREFYLQNVEEKSQRIINTAG